MRRQRSHGFHPEDTPTQRHHFNSPLPGKLRFLARQIRLRPDQDPQVFSPETAGFLNRTPRFVFAYATIPSSNPRNCSNAWRKRTGGFNTGTFPLPLFQAASFSICCQRSVFCSVVRNMLNDGTVGDHRCESSGTNIAVHFLQHPFEFLTLG